METAILTAETVDVSEISDQGTTQEEQTYVPDVVCSACGSTIYLDRQTYEWHNAEVRCRDCQAVLHVQIGAAYYDPVAKVSYSAIRPNLFTGRGGQLLGAPRIVSPPSGVPQELTSGMESEKIPEHPREAFRTAVMHYGNFRYDDASVRCRVAIEAALLQQGVEKDTPGKMVIAAQRDRLLVTPYDKMAQAVVSAGGGAAHPSAPPVGRADVLIFIGMTATCLRALYGVEG